MNNSYITIIKEKRTALSRKRIPLNQNGCTANFRIGVPFGQNLQTAFKKNAIYNLRYSKYKNKSIAFKFNLKKGWKLRGGISYARSNWGVAKMSPNGSKIKVAGGSGFLAVALAENIKTGQRERIHIYFK